MQDIFNSLLLSECVYKLLDAGGADHALRSLQALHSQAPATLVTLQAVQFSLPHVSHRCSLEPAQQPWMCQHASYRLCRAVCRYMVAKAEGVLLVAFLGTKVFTKDLTADIDVFQEAVWPEELAGAALRSQVLPAPVPDRFVTDTATQLQQLKLQRWQEMPSAHRGFLARARGIPIQYLYAHARSQGLRLVLCGMPQLRQMVTAALVCSVSGLPPPPSTRCAGCHASLGLLMICGWTQVIPWVVQWQRCAR